MFTKSIVRHNPGYEDRNARNKTHKTDDKRLSPCPFGFPNTRSGDYFDLTFDNDKLNSVRTMLHLNAKLAGIWIKTFIITKDKKTTTIRVINDGVRK